ncbi:hypothetical protein RSAG8_13395, partial [Rhizoctonia solani AG-8 WAC10335]
MSTTCLDSSLQWMMNSGGQSPCEVLESVLKVCEAGAKVPNLSVDVSCGSLGNSSSACCCSTATYALVSACWMCQTNRPPSQLSSTYQSWWSGCPVDSRLNGSLPAVVISQSPPIAVPRWALDQPPSTDASWNVSSAQLAVGITPSSTLSSIPRLLLLPLPSHPPNNQTLPTHLLPSAQPYWSCCSGWSHGSTAAETASLPPAPLPISRSTAESRQVSFPKRTPVRQAGHGGEKWEGRTDGGRARVIRARLTPGATHLITSLFRLAVRVRGVDGTMIRIDHAGTATFAPLDRPWIR